MLNTINIDNLIISEEENFLDVVLEDEVSEMSSAEAELKDICESNELNELARYLSERGIEYWLADAPRANPERNYRIWLSRIRGESKPKWGITPLDRAEPQHHERKHRS